jgi:hypothetical protein
MSDDPPDYYAYLIRLWRTGVDGPWRASLEDARTGERIGFGDLSQAYAYLRGKTGRPTEVTGTAEPLRGREDDGPPDTPASIKRCG